MAARKSARLHQRGDQLRGSPRRTVAIPGTCGIGERTQEYVLATNLGVRGCTLEWNAVGVTRSEPLVLWLGEVGPIAGRLKWAKGGALGVAFDAELAPEVLEELCGTAPDSAVVPLHPQMID